MHNVREILLAYGTHLVLSRALEIKCDAFVAQTNQAIVPYVREGNDEIRNE
jgi:hypothetical protein